MFVSQLNINTVGFLKHEKYPIFVLKRARFALLLYIHTYKQARNPGKNSNEDTDTEFYFA